MVISQFHFFSVNCLFTCLVSRFHVGVFSSSSLTANTFKNKDGEVMNPLAAT